MCAPHTPHSIYTLVPQVPGIREGAGCVRELEGWSGIHPGALQSSTSVLPSHLESLLSLWLQDSQLYISPTHALRESQYYLWSLGQRIQKLKAQLTRLPDEHLGRVLPLILK